MNSKNENNRWNPKEIFEDLCTRGIVRPTDNTKMGEKYDQEKPCMDLIPPEAIFALANVLTYGATKYSRRNWEKGMEWGRVFGACMRHLWCWWGGQGPATKSFLFGELDEETKFSHLWHALACITFLLTYEERGIGVDNRSS